MRWILAFHLISMVAWFAGLFYLPRLFVYHADSKDKISQDRFKIMEYKLFWYIMTPASVLTIFFGIWLLILNWQWYFTQKWMIAKLCCVFLLVIYHIICGYLLRLFQLNKNPYSSICYRFFNEVPTVLLFLIVILAVIKP